jgi:hypothetical protein
MIRIAGPLTERFPKRTTPWRARIFLGSTLAEIVPSGRQGDGFSLREIQPLHINKSVKAPRTVTLPFAARQYRYAWKPIIAGVELDTDF